MLTAYGHTKIEWGEKEFILSPSFINIAKIGSPTEIIDIFKQFISSTHLVTKFSIALNVLKCCSEPELPEALTGGVKFSKRQQKFMITQPSHGIDMINDIIVLAEHCLIHGVCGKVERGSQGEPATEFDAYSFMELARIHLEASVDDAAKMTMTEFARLMDAKFPPQKNENIGSKKEQEEMVAWLKEQNKVH
jgi:hypothetical protein